MAVIGAVSDQPRLQRRVLKSPIGSYSELDSESTTEHDEWRLRAAVRAAEVLYPGGSPRSAQTAVDRLADDLLRISDTLAVHYGTPDLGNKAEPVDELVYIILARRTREIAYQPAYLAIKARYATWEELAAAPLKEIEDVVRFTGLGSRKAQSLKFALEQLIERFGSCTLEPTRTWSDEQTLAFLSTLPEIGPKSAACIMVCSLDRPAFAVDSHVGRVLERMGIFGRIGIDLVGAGHKVKQYLLWDAVPPALRYVLHVNLLVHGRERCLPGKPRCGNCPIANDCQYAQTRLGSSGRPDP